jgi:anti-anti-sigma factor
METAMSDMIQTSRLPMVLELGGDISIANAKTLGDCLCHAIDLSGCGIVVDLTEVPFIDSSAAAMMLRVHRVAIALECNVTWRGIQRAPARVLNVMGLDQLLQLDRPTEADGK